MNGRLSARRLLGVTINPAAMCAAALVGLTLASCTRSDASDAGDHAGDNHANHGHAGHDHGGGAETHTDEVRLTADAIERYAVRVEPAQLWILRPTVVAPARVAFNTQAMSHVGSTLRGRVVEIRARAGDSVRVGQDLLVVESPELGEAQADLLNKRLAVQAAEPTAELTRAAWERARNLHEQSQGIALAEVQRREAEYNAAIAAIKAAAAAAKASENMLRVLGMNQEAIDALAASGEISPLITIRSAIDGVVVQSEVTPGELVGPDRETIMVVADMGTLWVLAEVHESQLAGIAPGSQAWVTLGLPASSDDGPLHAFEGAVAHVAPFVDPVTRTAQVRIEVPASFGGGVMLRPGMFAMTEIVQDASEADAVPSVAVPEEAIQTVEGGPAVFVPVPGEPGTFAKRAVTVGKLTGGLVSISSGLVEGELFVVSGTFILKAELGKGSAAHEH